jgi:CMP-N-acetylneuraminic acid synthetase
MSGPARTAGIDMAKRKYRVLWLVLARSGSKSIPNKNIKLLAGIPLLAYRVKSVRAIAPKEDVWISTDSAKYASIAVSYGATAPFLRPKVLAGDQARSEDAVLHAMEYAEKTNDIFDAICILEPTSPFVKPSQMLHAVSMLDHSKKAGSIVAVKEARPNTFFVQDEASDLAALSMRIKNRGKHIRRQDFRKQITPSGGFYIAKWESFKKDHTVYTKNALAYLLPDINALEIDEPLDWTWAEFLLKEKIIRKRDLFGRDR